MIAWLFTTNVIYGIDAIIWGNNADIVVPVWCDIGKSALCILGSGTDFVLTATKILVGANMALPAACMCVCIYMCNVSKNPLATILT